MVADPIEFDILRESALLELRGMLTDLKEEEYSDQDIYQLLLARREKLPYRLSNEEMGQITQHLNLQPPPQDQPAPDRAKLLRQAIANRDITALWELVDVLATLKQMSAVSYGVTMAEIKEAFGKSLNMRDFGAAVAQVARNQKLAESGTKPDVATVAYNWAMAHRNLWAYDEQWQTWRMFNDEYWEEQADKASFLDQYAVIALQEAEIPVNSSNALNCFQRLAASHCKRKFEQAPNKVNFANGTLDLTTMQLGRFNLDDNFIYCLPYSLDMYSQHQRINAFLSETITELDQDGNMIPNRHGIQAYAAHIGLALIGDTLMHKALVALGQTRSGKSTLLDLAHLVCGLPAKQYVPDDVFSTELEGKRSRYTHGKKRIACVDEVPAEALHDEEIFKQMSAHSGVPMRGINKDDLIDNQWRPKLLLNSNDDPHYKDISGAIKQRLIIIRCPNQRFEEPEDDQPGQNKKLLDDLAPEIGAFAWSCIVYALEVLEKGYYPQSATMKRELDQIATAGNPLKACIEDKFILDPSPDAWTVTKDLHDVYTAYCAELGNIKALGRPHFAIALCNMGIGVRNGRKNHERVLFGIRIRTGMDPHPTDEQERSRYKDSKLLEWGQQREQQGQQGTAKNSGCPHHESASQANSQDSGTAGTANLENLNYSKTVFKQDDIDIPVSNSANCDDLLSLPSPEVVTPLYKPSQNGDSNKKQPSPSRPQPLPKLPNRDCIVCGQRAWRWNNELDRAECMECQRRELEERQAQ